MKMRSVVVFVLIVASFLFGALVTYNEPAEDQIGDFIKHEELVGTPTPPKTGEFAEACTLSFMACE